MTFCCPAHVTLCIYNCAKHRATVVAGDFCNGKRRLATLGGKNLIEYVKIEFSEWSLRPVYFLECKESEREAHARDTVKSPRSYTERYIIYICIHAVRDYFAISFISQQQRLVMKHYLYRRDMCVCAQEIHRVRVYMRRTWARLLRRRSRFLSRNICARFYNQHTYNDDRFVLKLDCPWV